MTRDLVRAVPVVRVAARELERRLVRFGAGIAEEHALGERRVDETLGEPQRRFVREPVGDVPELSRLLGQRPDERRMAMAERGHRHAAREIDVHPAILVPDARAFAAHRNECRRRVARHHPLVEQLARHRHRGGAARHGDRVAARRAATTALAAAESGGMAFRRPRPGTPRRPGSRRDTRRGELRLDGRAGGRMARDDPLFPDGVHRGEVADVGQEDRRREDLRLVRAGFGEQASISASTWLV